MAGGCDPAAPVDSAVPDVSTADRMSLDLTEDVATEEAPGEAAAPAPVFDFESAERPLNEETRAEMSDLDILNQILTDYQEARRSVSPPPGRYKTEAEEMAALEAWEARLKAMPPVKDLSELVKAGIIKAVPAAPPGQQYVIDPKTQTVVLVSAP
jgi:hypothetical protein